jgi:hypothetical protein
VAGTVPSRNSWAAMSRFFFDTFDGQTWIMMTRASTATERRARELAQSALGDIARDELPHAEKLVMAGPRARRQWRRA